MAKLPTPFDPRLPLLLRRCETDHEAAKELLCIATQYLRANEKLPGMLADYLANAFESATSKPQELRAKQLTDELNLTANNKRKASVDWLDAYELMQEKGEMSVNELSIELAKRFGTGKTIATNRIKQAQKYLQADRRE